MKNECFENDIKAVLDIFSKLKIIDYEGEQFLHGQLDIIDASGKNLSIDYDNTKPTIKTKLGVNITKAKKLFNWAPKVSLEEGIVKTLNWYKKHLL